MLDHKIDFSVIISATDANPNGDPLNGNCPRQSFDGRGEITDVCIKRKIRNRLQDMHEKIFVQTDDRCDDGCKSLYDRMCQCESLKKVLKGKNTDRAVFKKIACQEWIDVRSFGAVFAFKVENDKDEKKDNVSVPVRGPITIREVFSVSPIEIISTQITKSVNGSSGKESKSSDTMGMKHRVAFGLYVINGSINCQTAELTGFSNEDAEKIKEALCTLFENDASSARPEGSMVVHRVYWWEHDSKTPKVSTKTVHEAVQIDLKEGVETPTRFEDYNITLREINGVKPEVIDLM